jgi:RNA polymerase sigma factor (sigma-70 family)
MTTKEPETPSAKGRSAGFPATRWSVVLSATREPGGTEARRALEELAQIYWFPLYAFARRLGNTPEEAEDLTQGFFAQLVEKESLAAVDRSRGKFRSFLLASLKNFLSDERDKARALKRGGGRTVVSLDALAAEAQYAKDPADDTTPERVFERNWALAVLNRVVLRLEEEHARDGKEAVFRALRHTLDGESMEGAAYAEIAGQLGMSEGAMRLAAHRIRRRYRKLLRDEILQTVAAPELVDEEIRYLMECL